jgi:ribosome-binding factor A
MESKRQQKVARQIQKDLSDIFQKELSSELNNAFITVTQVRMSPDLSVARVYLSFLLAKDNAAVLKSIKEKTKQIRTILGNKIRHQVRIVPALNFFEDDTAEYAAHIDAIITGLNIPPAPAEEETE